MNTPILSLPFVPQGTLDPAAGLNDVIRILDALVQTRPISMSLTAPPMTSSDGDMYVVAGEGGTATGAWLGHENDLAVYVDDGNFWVFYAAGTQVNLLLNQDDGNLYKFIPDSPNAWVLAAGLGDAPSDGEQYVRRNETWQALVPFLTVHDEDSPPTVSAQAVEVIIAHRSVEIVEVSPGIVRIEVAPAQVVDEAGALTEATVDAYGLYTRFSHAAAEYHFGDNGSSWKIGAEYHGRYVGAGNLILTSDTGFTINPPTDGTLLIPPGGSFTVKIVSTTEADLIGITEEP